MFICTSVHLEAVEPQKVGMLVKRRLVANQKLLLLILHVKLRKNKTVYDFLSFPGDCKIRNLLLQAVYRWAGHS